MVDCSVPAHMENYFPQCSFAEVLFPTVLEYIKIHQIIIPKHCEIKTSRLKSPLSSYYTITIKSVPNATAVGITSLGGVGRTRAVEKNYFCCSLKIISEVELYIWIWSYRVRQMDLARNTERVSCFQHHTLVHYTLLAT